MATLMEGVRVVGKMRLRTGDMKIKRSVALSSLGWASPSVLRVGEEDAS